MLLTVAAPATESERMEAVARELLARLDMLVVLRRREQLDLAELRRPPSAEQGYFARVWIALPPSGRARLYLEHGESDRVLVRDVNGDGANAELVREELGHILQAAVEGLKAGEAIGEPRRVALRDVVPDEAPASLVAAPAQDEIAAPRRRATLRFGPRYEVTWVAADHLEDGPGAVLELALPVGVELAAYYRRPKTVRAEPVGVRLQTLAVRPLAELELWRGQGARAQVGAGMGLDFVRVSPVASASGAASVPDRTWLVLAMARLQASYARRALGFFELELALGLDVDLSSTRYIFQRNAGELTVLDPWRLRPALSLGGTVP